MSKNEYVIGQNSEKRQDTSAMPGGRGAPGGMSATGEKAGNFQGSIKKLLAYCRPYLPAIVIALVCAALGVVLTLVGPGKLSEITDLVTQGLMSGIDLQAVAGIGLLLVGIYLAGMLLSALQGLIMATVTQQVSKGLRSSISRKINRLPMKTFQRISNGDILSRTTNDVDTIGQTLNQSLGTLVTAVVMLVGSLLMMLLTNVWMTLTAVLASVLGFALMMVIMSK